MKATMSGKVLDCLLNWVLKVASGAKTRAETVRFEDPIELYFLGPSL